MFFLLRNLPISIENIIEIILVIKQQYDNIYAYAFFVTRFKMQKTAELLAYCCTLIQRTTLQKA